MAREYEMVGGGQMSDELKESNLLKGDNLTNIEIYMVLGASKNEKKILG